jgi:hypothetical protein
MWYNQCTSHPSNCLEFANCRDNIDCLNKWDEEIKFPKQKEIYQTLKNEENGKWCNLGTITSERDSG